MRGKCLLCLAHRLHHRQDARFVTDYAERYPLIVEAISRLGPRDS
jgi:hypothetical protein